MVHTYVCTYVLGIYELNSKDNSKRFLYGKKFLNSQILFHNYLFSSILLKLSFMWDLRLQNFVHYCGLDMNFVLLQIRVIICIYMYVKICMHVNMSNLYVCIMRNS